jgi:hypothetical protein
MNEFAVPQPNSELAALNRETAQRVSERQDYDGVSCNPMAVSSGPKDAALALRLRCGLDTLFDRTETGCRRLAIRGLGLADKIATRVSNGSFHRRFPRIRDWRTPVPLVAPIFIVGSPRSGTTILGKVLGHQGDVLFLNEARPIWYRAVPELDQSRFHWRGVEPQGRLYLDESDFNRLTKASLEHGFGWALRLAGRQRLLEKMPINLFCVRWLRAMWPDATFLQVMRDPLSSTASKTHWWSSRYEDKSPGIELRRRMFLNLFPELASLLGTISTAYEWFLFEWRVYTQEGERLKRTFPDQYHIVRLEDAQENPDRTFDELCDFARLRFTGRLRRAYQTMLERRIRLATPKLDSRRCTELLGQRAERWGYHM